MTFYVRLSRQHCRPVLRYPVQLSAEIFDSARIDHAEFALALTIPGAVLICEANQPEKWRTLVKEFAPWDSAIAAAAIPLGETVPPAGGEGGS
jgi:hypothetical protein